METTFNSIKPGSKVTILVNSGIGRNGPERKRATGRAVMFNREQNLWVLNMGGRYGTPGIASVDNVVEVR